MHSILTISDLNYTCANKVEQTKLEEMRKPKQKEQKYMTERKGSKKKL
jgi:hypothetical protein